ncbi:uncharacterized protein LOC109605279 isoform X4 [Aethina tumida]|uniref:uncharacterized protein LOC109605279 isoform X4 n=1 Tax=Aethina tumida TaxID=116153 RepID=UPI002148E38C|nr:uncharacterized protein LOC109605279 isoform X4 [Aethina tumida]
MVNLNVKTKHIWVWENRNPINCAGVWVRPRELRTMDLLCEYVQQKLKLNKAVYGLINLQTKEKVKTIEDIEDDGRYIASDTRDLNVILDIKYLTMEEIAKLRQPKACYLYEQGDSDYKAHKFLNETKRLQKTIIFVFLNGHEKQRGQKIVLTREDLDGRWQIILNYVSHLLGVYPCDIEALYTVDGKKVCGAYDLQHGSAYVAVRCQEKFQKLNYIEIYDTYFPKMSSFEVGIKAVSSPANLLVRKRPSFLCKRKCIVGHKRRVNPSTEKNGCHFNPKRKSTISKTVSGPRRTRSELTANQVNEPPKQVASEPSKDRKLVREGSTNKKRPLATASDQPQEGVPTKEASMGTETVIAGKVKKPKSAKKNVPPTAETKVVPAKVDESTITTNKCLLYDETINERGVISSKHLEYKELSSGETCECKDEQERKKAELEQGGSTERKTDNTQTEEDDSDLKSKKKKGEKGEKAKEEEKKAKSKSKKKKGGKSGSKKRSKSGKSTKKKGKSGKKTKGKKKTGKDDDKEKASSGVDTEKDSGGKFKDVGQSPDICEAECSTNLPLCPASIPVPPCPASMPVSPCPHTMPLPRCPVTMPVPPCPANIPDKPCPSAIVPYIPQTSMDSKICPRRFQPNEETSMDANACPRRNQPVEVSMFNASNAPCKGKTAPSTSRQPESIGGCMFSKNSIIIRIHSVGPTQQSPVHNTNDVCVGREEDKNVIRELLEKLIGNIANGNIKKVENADDSRSPCQTPTPCTCVRPEPTLRICPFSLGYPNQPTTTGIKKGETCTPQPVKLGEPSTSGYPNSNTVGCNTIEGELKKALSETVQTALTLVLATRNRGKCVKN